ncbi:MAG: nucleotidyltransferase [Anaerolineales bacterium]
MNVQSVLAKLKKLKPILLARYKAKEIGLFGSFVRGEQTKDSDIDVLVEFESDADLFDLIGLAQFLEEELQRKVDVIPKRALREELRPIVLPEVIAV